MSQLITINPGSVPALPNDLVDLISAEASKSQAALTSGTFNILRPKRNLELTIDGVKEEIEYGKFAGILVTSAEFNHAVWYKQEYRAGMVEAPDLVWIMKEQNKFPDALPAQFRQKIGAGANAHWAFQIRRRTVWVRATQAGIDFDHPFILDIPSSLLYGKSTMAGACTWRDIINLCKQESQRGVSVYPGMFLTKFIAYDRQLPGLFYFQPVCTPQGFLQYLSVDTIRRVILLAQDPDVKDMATVREKLEYDNSGAQQPVAQPAPQSVAQPVQPAPQPVAQPVQPVQPVQPAPQPAAPVTPAAPQQPASFATAQGAPQGTSELMTDAAAMLNNLVQQNISANQPAAAPAGAHPAGAQPVGGQSTALNELQNMFNV